MALPSSGQISIADIRNEGVSGGCYKSTDPYSLGMLADAFEIPTDPDAMSEFYSKTCPLSVAVYANYYASPTNETTGSYAVYYSINSGGGDILFVYGDSISTTCSLIGTITGFAAGDTIYIGWTNTSKLRSPFQFDGTKSTTSCPNTQLNTYCGTNNVGGNALRLENVTTPVQAAITIDVVKGYFTTCI